MPGPGPRFRNPISFGVRMKKRELALLRRLASMRNRSAAMKLVGHKAESIYRR